MTDILGPANAGNAVVTRKTEGRVFGSSDTWFKDCSTPAAQDGTDITADFLDGILAQFRAAIRGNGKKNDGVTAIVAEDNTNDAMLLGAILQLIQRGQANFVVDTGTADAIVVAPSPALAEYEVGLRLLVLKNPLVGANATTTPKINAGQGAATIVKNDGSALGIGDLKKAGLFEIEFDGTNARLVSLLTISDVLALMQSSQTSTLVTGGHYITYTPGTYSWTVPAGIYSFQAKAWGAGGGGGGAGSSSANAGGATGGAAGGYAEGAFAVTPGQVIPIVVGSGGAPGTASGTTVTNGVTGGTTSVGSFLSATGGGGGLCAYGSLQNSNSVPGTGSGPFAATGIGGGYPVAITTGAVLGGLGGAAPQGGGPTTQYNENAPGQQGIAPGGGASGGAAPPGNVAFAGGTGGGGLVKITY